MLLELPRGEPEVRLADDVVAVEHRPRLVAGDRHRHPLGDPRPDHVADRRPPEVVEEPAAKTGGPARGPPRLVEPLHPVGPLRVEEHPGQRSLAAPPAAEKGPLLVLGGGWRCNLASYNFLFLKVQERCIL